MSQQSKKLVIAAAVMLAAWCAHALAQGAKPKAVTRLDITTRSQIMGFTRAMNLKQELSLTASTPTWRLWINDLTSVGPVGVVGMPVSGLTLLADERAGDVQLAFEALAAEHATQIGAFMAAAVAANTPKGPHPWNEAQLCRYIPNAAEGRRWLVRITSEILASLGPLAPSSGQTKTARLSEQEMDPADDDSHLVMKMLTPDLAPMLSGPKSAAIPLSTARARGQ